MSWKAIAKAAQAEVLDSIPAKWKLSGDKYRSLTNVTSVPQDCGILSDEQLAITDLTALGVVKRIESHELTAVQVLEAFAARTAIAHQLVRVSPFCLVFDLQCPGQLLDGLVLR
jgi:amidase